LNLVSHVVSNTIESNSGKSTPPSGWVMDKGLLHLLQQAIEIT